MGAAYTNNDADPNTATTLFDIDSALDQVAIQAPPNSGQLNATGKLGVDTGRQLGLTLHLGQERLGRAQRRLHVAVRRRNIGLLRHQPADRQGRIQGRFASSNQVVGIAIPINQG